ncbi:MAG: hypothetical protein QOI54_1391 [Actinomycetota bacterium]|nr:hypothetical protein [Actinomycetota bacterium]
MTDRPDEPAAEPRWAAPGSSPQVAPDGPPGPLSSGWASEQPPPATAYPPPAAAGAPPPQGWATAPGWVPPPAAARPGVIPLRPLGVGEILDGAISTIRAKARVMLGLSAVLAVLTQLLTVPVTWLLLRDSGDRAFSTTSPGTPLDLTFTASAVTAASVQALVTLVATLLLTGVLTVVLSRKVLGQDIDAADAWAQARPRLPALVGVTLLVIAIELGLAVLTLAPGIVLGLAGAPAVAVAGALVLGIPAFLAIGSYLYVAFALAPAAVVLERASVRRSLRRSVALVRGAWWRTFGILALVNVIAQMLAAILSVPFSMLSLGVAFLTGGSDNLNPYTILPLLITSIGTILASALTWPFTAVSIALIYVDRRIRREGLDLQLARAAGLTPTGSSATPGTPLGPTAYDSSTYGG